MWALNQLNCDRIRTRICERVPHKVIIFHKNFMLLSIAANPVLK